MLHCCLGHYITHLAPRIKHLFAAPVVHNVALYGKEKINAVPAGDIDGANFLFASAGESGLVVHSIAPLYEYRPEGYRPDSFDEMSAYISPENETVYIFRTELVDRYVDAGLDDSRSGTMHSPAALSNLFSLGERRRARSSG